MTKHYDDGRVAVHHGHCLDVLRTMPDSSVDAVVTDPPYGLSATTPAGVTKALQLWATGDREHVPDGKGFMGKDWDAFVPPPAVWDECYRALKPGGHLLAFAGSRTQDLMGLSIRLAGFEIRDSIAWLYGSGFPKSLDVSKAIDKAAGAEREVVGERKKLQSYGSTTDGAVNAVFGCGPDKGGVQQITAPATDAAREWAGWGTALKPAHEPIVVARKPLDGTVAANVLTHGTGALNIDATRIATTETLGRFNHARGASAGSSYVVQRKDGLVDSSGGLGRHPANVILDESQAEALDEQTGFPASRFFYCAKAPKSERPVVDGVAHATVKPLTLMRYLVRLVTPAGGVVLDPFAGSGTTAEACTLEGFRCITIERDPDYLPLIVERLIRGDVTGKPDVGTADAVTAVELDGQDALFDLGGDAA